MKIYIAGKIKGLKPVHVARKFREAQIELEPLGFKVQNPFELIGRINNQRKLSGDSILTDKENRKEILSICLRALLKCDAILMLPDWQESEGATLEHNTAKAVGMEIFYCLSTIKSISNMLEPK